MGCRRSYGFRINIPVNSLKQTTRLRFPPHFKRSQGYSQYTLQKHFPLNPFKKPTYLCHSLDQNNKQSQRIFNENDEDSPPCKYIKFSEFFLEGLYFNLPQMYSNVVEIPNTPHHTNSNCRETSSLSTFMRGTLNFPDEWLVSAYIFFDNKRTSRTDLSNS